MRNVQRARAGVLHARLGPIAVLATAAALVGCQVYDPALLGERDSGTPPMGCENLRTPPDRPPSSTEGDDVEDHSYFLRRVVLDQSGGAWENIGLDLDGRCTQPPDNDSECSPPGAPRPPTDGNDGIDNVFGGRLFGIVDIALMAQSGVDLQLTAETAQENGKGPVMRLRGWNGTDDDPRVEVAISNSIFTIAPNEAGEVPPFEIDGFFEPVDPTTREILPRPRWDGNDVAYFREDTFLDSDPDVPLINDDNAYVAGGVVVARLPERFEILFPAQDLGVLVRLTDARALGTLSADRLSLENVVVAGRWRVLDLLETAENIGVCADTSEYGILQGQLDNIADVRATPGSGGEGVECNAISVGVGFTGTRVRYGGLQPGPFVVNVCELGPDGGMPDGGTDAGPRTDGGTVDAGPVDAGPADAGPADAGPDGG